jgi:hypothetical protein
MENLHPATNSKRREGVFARPAGVIETQALIVCFRFVNTKAQPPQKKFYIFRDTVVAFVSLRHGNAPTRVQSLLAQKKEKAGTRPALPV